MFHRLKPLLSVASLILTILVVSAYALPTARAADIVISDEASCRAAGGVWLMEDTCTFTRVYTLAAGNTLTSTVMILLEFRGGFINNGSMIVDGTLFDSRNIESINNSTMLINRDARISGSLRNNGTITNTSLFLLTSDGALTNYGVFNGNIDNNGTVINNCPGVINGEVDGGTYINNCVTATPTATFTRTPTASNTATFTPTNTPVPPSTTPSNTPSNTPVPPSATFTNTPSNTPVPPTSTYTNTPSNTPVPPTSTSTNTPTNTATNTATNTLTPSNTPTSTFTPTPSGFAKAQFNHGNEISVTKSERPSIIFQYGATTGLPLTNPRLECSISGQATFVTPVGANGFTTVNATATTLNFSGRAPLKNGQNYSATFKVNPGTTVGQISTLTCTLLGDNIAPVSDTLNIRVR